MFQGVKNQYKTSCLDNLFSAFLPLPKQRVLSDKKIEKQKKINLSLTEDKRSKSSRKLTLCNSFHSKQTPSTSECNWRIKQETTNVPISPIKPNRGLNFHPRKISFSNQLEKPKITTQTIYPLSSVPLKLQSNKSYSTRKNNQQKSLLVHKIQDKKQLKIFNDDQPNKLQYNKPLSLEKFNVANQFDIQLNKIRRQIQDTVKQIQSIKNQALNKTKQNQMERTYPNSEKPQEQSRATIKNNSCYFSKIQQTYQNQRKSMKNVSQNILLTPKNNQKQYVHLNQNKKQKKEQNKYLISKKITNLYDGLGTIQSKYDGSSQQEKSVCFSNVVERINLEQLKFTAKKSPLKTENSYQKRNSIQTNLFDKYIENGINFRNTQNISELGFRKRKNILTDRLTYQWQAHQSSSKNLSHQDSSKNLKLIQDLYINNINDEQLNNKSISQSESKDVALNKKSQSIYQQFVKINYLGVGRFASVYLCVISQLNFIFVIKQILKFTISFNKLQKQISKQIQIQYSCDHPNIISMYHAWNDEKKYYIALEYGQQTLLNKIEKNYMIKQEDCIKYIYEILKGLEYLHRKGILHRDIKPQNIILVNGLCKIGDFGWATQLKTQSLIQACGTPCYICPQMQRGQKYTAKADCWSLGILAYELINGKLDESFFGKQNLNRDNLKYIHQVSEKYKNLVYCLLAQQQKDRPSSCELLNWSIFKSKQ